MRRLYACAVAIVMLAIPSTARAQWVVYDPSNYAQAVTRYLQLVQQYEFWVEQARRLPASAASRYRVPEVPWRAYVGESPVLTSLSTGLGTAAAYAAAVDPVDSLADVLTKAPDALRGRLALRHGAISVSDQLALAALQQAGSARANGLQVLRAIQAMEDDALSGPTEFHTQTALLNKINGASVLGLRIAERNTQFLAHTVEQLLLDNVRKRQAETQLMNAHSYQWRYGQRYGSEMFDKTAQRLDSWQQP